MVGRRHPEAKLIAGGLALVGILAAQERPAGPAVAAIGEARAAAPVAAMRWTDPDGKPLPFRSEEELLEFLRTADVKSEKVLSGGVTFPTKVLLEKDGIRADAIFRDVDEQRSMPTFGAGRTELYYRDSYIFEPAAYELSRLLGLDNVPPATLRKLHGKNGSVQIWVENAMTERSRVKDKVQPPDDQQWNKQLAVMNVFDALVFNTDRNRGNILITPDWKLWMIDHTRAFRRNPVLREGVVLNHCERGMYQRLKDLDEAVVRERLKPYLSSFEMDALMQRRRLILEQLDKLIAERGEEKVLYTYIAGTVPPPPGNPN
jgi:hypothetical protein